jgi:hypothetical protein
LMRRLSGRFPVEVGAPRAGLNPKVHLSVVGNFERHAASRCS